MKKYLKKKIFWFFRCDVARSRLLDLITNKYKEINDDISNLLIGGEELNEDDEFNLKSALKKVECFYTCHNLTNYGIWQSKYFKIERWYYSKEKFWLDRSKEKCCIIPWVIFVQNKVL